MGFLGGIIHAITQPVTRITGKYTPFIFPAITVTQVAGNLVDKIAGGALSPHGSHPTQVQQRIPVPTNLAPRQPIAYGQGPQYYGGGGGFAPSFDYPPAQPAQPFYGGSPWDYSTPSQAYSPTWSPMYSARQDRTWEDLATIALPFIL